MMTDAIIDGAVNSATATNIAEAVTDTVTAVSEFVTQDMPQWVSENEGIANRRADILRTAGSLGTPY
jgi:pentose-5-phosphate-3-epimerase